MSSPYQPQRREFLTGQTPPGDRQARQATDSQDAIGDPAPLFSFSTNAMGCEFQILCDQAMQQPLAQNINAGFSLIAELEQQMTVYRQDSEISQINQRAGRSAVAVERELLDLIVDALKLSKLTEGAFDITAAPLTRLWNFHRRNGQLPAPDQIATVLKSIGSRLVIADQPNSTIRFSCPDVQLDLGGIGKGYALDRLAELLVRCGVGEFLIHGGQSSIVARGQRRVARGPETRPWVVGLSHPLVPATRIAEIELGDEALGTSGSGRQSFVHEGRHYGHIIDPRSGWPADRWLSVTVITEHAMYADALATGLFAMDDQALDEFCTIHRRYAVIALGASRAHPRRLTARLFNLSAARLRWLDPAIDVSVVEHRNTGQI